MDEGVTIFQPQTCVIDSDVVVGPDSVIEPFVQLLGKTRIGADCRIRSYSIVKDSEIADGVIVNPLTVTDDARIGRDAIIGPYSRLRPGTTLEKARTLATL